jgi:hypothetical protein
MKVTVGINPQYVANPDRLSVAQLKDMQAQGHDVVSHTYGHINLNNATLAEAESDFKADHNWYKANGFKVPESMIYPWGLNRANESMKNLVRQYYKYALTFSTNYNRVPMDNMWVQRVDLAQKTLVELKQEVDNAFYNNGLVIFFTHAHYPEGDGAGYFPTQKIKDLIDHIKTVRNMPIMTLTEALEKKGNIIQAGEGSKYDRFFALAKDGQIAMPQNVNIVKDRSYPINTTIINFPDKTLSIVAVSQADDNFVNKGGTLFIFRYDTAHGFEIYFPNGTTDMYKRNWTYGASAWDPFINMKKVNLTESFTVSTTDMGTITANSVKQILKTLNNITINTAKYHINVVPTNGIPSTIVWSYGINSGANAIQINLANPRATDTTPSGGLSFEVMMIEK